MKDAIPRGFHKKILLFGGSVAGQIEYAPSEASGYPISGENIVVVNRIRVLRKAEVTWFRKAHFKQHDLKREKKASGFATIGLEGHWNPWFRREHMEQPGFKSVDSSGLGTR